MNATLYLVSNAAFELLERRPDKNKVPAMAHNVESFEKIYEGLEFLLDKCFTGEDRELVQELFSRTEFIGESLDENPFKLHTPDEVDDFEARAIYYLDPEKIARIDYLLSELDETEVLNAYNAKEFNNNGVYPELWHDDESENQFFNKTHLKNALKNLTDFFGTAISNNDHVIIFTEF
jgi:hypothetical protein